MNTNFALNILLQLSKLHVSILGWCHNVELIITAFILHVPGNLWISLLLNLYTIDLCRRYGHAVYFQQLFCKRLLCIIFYAVLCFGTPCLYLKVDFMIAWVSDVAIGASLSGGHEVSQGQLQVFVNGRWGAVCNNRWDSTDGKYVILLFISLSLFQIRH